MKLERIAIFFAAVALSLPLVGPLRAQAADKVSIGAVPGDVTSMGPWYAKAGEFDKKYDLDLEVVTIEGGSRGLQVLLSGNIQAMLVGFSAMVNANQQGADLRVITATSNVMPMDFYVTPNIKSGDDLKGKTLAISSFTAETDMALSLALDQLGVKRDEVVVMQLGGSSNRIAGIEAGRAVGSPFVAPGTTMAEKSGLVKLVDLGQEGAPYLFNSMVVGKKSLADERDLLKRLIKAIVEADCRAVSDPDWGRKVIAEQFKTDDSKVIDDAYAVFKRVTPLDATPSDAAIKNVIDLVQTLGTKLSKAEPSDHVDLGIVEELQKEGFFEEMKKQYGL